VLKQTGRLEWLPRMIQGVTSEQDMSMALHWASLRRADSAGIVLSGYNDDATSFSKSMNIKDSC